jgi:hypothetical protein
MNREDQSKEGSQSIAVMGVPRGDDVIDGAGSGERRGSAEELGRDQLLTTKHDHGPIRLREHAPIRRSSDATPERLMDRVRGWSAGVRMGLKTSNGQPLSRS